MAASDKFYLDMRAEVDNVLREFGTSYQVRSKGVYDPTTMEIGSGLSKPLIGITANQQQVMSFTGGVSGSWLATKTLIISATSEINETESVLVDGHWYSLDKLEPIKPADINVVYLLDIS